MKTLNLTIMALLTALICVLAPLSIPIGPVPVSLTPMVLFLIVYLVGGCKGAICYAVYIALGAVGLPVFSGYEGGLQKLAGPTGGYIVGFIFLVAICGGFLYIWKGKLWAYIIGMVVGIIVAYAFGSVWFMISLEQTLKHTLAVCVIPFLPFDAAKIVLVAVLGPVLKKSLRNVQGMSNIIKY